MRRFPSAVTTDLRRAGALGHTLVVEEHDSVQRLLDDLCADLGFCLPPSERLRLREAPPTSVDAFTDAVFRAEGMDPRLHTAQRRQVRDRIERRLPRQADGTDR